MPLWMSGYFSTSTTCTYKTNVSQTADSLYQLEVPLLDTEQQDQHDSTGQPYLDLSTVLDCGKLVKRKGSVMPNADKRRKGSKVGRLSGHPLWMTRRTQTWRSRQILRIDKTDIHTVTIRNRHADRKRRNVPMNLTFQTRCGNIRESGPKRLILLHSWPKTDLMPSGPARPPLLFDLLTYKQTRNQSQHYHQMNLYSILFLIKRQIHISKSTSSLYVPRCVFLSMCLLLYLCLSQSVCLSLSLCVPVRVCESH